MKKIIIVVALMILAGCALLNNNGKNKIEKILEDRCNSKDNICEKGKVFYQREIETVGYYGLATVEHEGSEKLVYIEQTLGGGIYQAGAYSTGPVNTEEDYFMFENLHSDFGHANNYYLYIRFGYVEEAEYDGESLIIDRAEFSLNGEMYFISAFLINLEKDVFFQNKLLVLK